MIKFWRIYGISDQPLNCSRSNKQQNEPSEIWAHYYLLKSSRTHKQELQLVLTPQVSWSRAGVRVNQHTYCYAVIHPDQKTLLNYSYREKSMLICFVVLSTAVVGASLSSGEAQPFPERRAGDWALRESGSSKSLLWVLSHRLPGKTR